VLASVEISNFQSLHRVRLEFGRFTVVTGPSDSGKSAVFRALGLVASNARGTSYISTGAKSCAVMLTADDGMGVVIVRGGRGQDAYVLDLYGEQRKYTKLGGGVPEAVSTALALGPLNFARQIDPPFLLTGTGTEVARTLGELTNVTLVFSAAAEASRRRKETTRDLKSAESRHAALLAEVQQFRGLRERRAAIDAAEEALRSARVKALARDRLRDLAGRLGVSQEAAAAARAVAVSQAPPPLESLYRLADRLARVKSLVRQLDMAEREAARYAADARDELSRAGQLHNSVHAALVAAGQCPTCGSTISA
jgi:DNA repair protein SbcC/Rad50